MKKILLYAAVPALLLVGCTKETAEPEVSTPQVKGTSTIIADYVSDSETRTVMGGDANYHWSSGDAIGVFNAEAGDRSNVRFRFTDENIFKGDMEFLGDEAYYAYYPQVDGKKITEDETIEINLSNSQNFNFERKDQVVGPVKGSFADGVVPSVAYGEATDENTLHMTFRPAASYIIVPVTGNGTVKSLTMTASKAMVGTLSIDLTALKELESDLDQLPNSAVMLKNGKTSIEVYCGKNGVTLDPKEPTYFWFAVAPGVQANGKYTFKFNDDSEHVKTVVYNGSANEQKTGTTPFTNVGKVRLLDTVDWTDTKLPLPVESEWEFIIYAYASAYGITPAANEILNLKETDGTLRPAHITRDLDFANAVIPEEEELPIDMSNSWLKAVLNEYKTNAEGLSGVSGAVTSLGGELNYEIIGAKDGAKQTYIRNLSVKAPVVTNKTNTAGIFGGNGNVKDIRIEKANVYNSNASTSGVASFLTNIVANHKFENVTINGGTLTADASIFAIVPELTATQAKNAADAKVVTVASYPKANKTTVLPYANKFTVNNNVTFDKKNENNALNIKLLVKATETAFDKFNTIAPSNTGFIVTVDNAADLAAAVNALATPVEEGSNAKLNQSPTSWISIMGADGTSYWTGVVPAAERKYNTTIVTAEDLARVVKAGNGTVNMTNDINLSNLGDKWIDGVLPTVYATASVVDINGKDSDEKIHTISNIKLSPKQMTVPGDPRGDGAYAKSLSLFGAVANLADVKISGITIEDTNLEEGVPTFGLASMTKSVENVVIENFRVNISHPNPEIPVGLFGTVPATATLNNIETNAEIYWGTGYDKEVAAEVARGVIAGELVCGKDTQTYDGLTVTGMSQYANKPFGKITVKLEEGYNTYELIFTNFVGNEEALSASSAPVQFEDAAIPTGAEVSFVTMVNGARDYRTYTKK